MERERVGQGQGKRGGILHRRVRFQRSTFAVHRARVDEDRNGGGHDGSMSADSQELIETTKHAAGDRLLSPPRAGPANEQLANIIGAVDAKQKFFIAESYGGEDEPVDLLAKKLAELGVPRLFPPSR